jgi:2,4-dienoyl-CoA reductase-like NADH-dependent reductase (Old Yellow Enzyme family)
MDQNNSSQTLFEATKLGDVELKNRLVLSPMCTYSAIDGMASDFHLVHIGKFAQGGFSLVFVEATAVTETGRITHGDLGIWKDEQIAPLSRLASFIKASGSVPGIQIAHAGRKACMQRPWLGNSHLSDAEVAAGNSLWATVGPTSTPMGDGWIVPRQLNSDDLAELLESFKSAALRALKAGFEVIEIHSAHGYLLHQFLSPLTNTRTDEFGGGIQGRMKFPLQVAAAVRSVWPKGKPMFFRISAVDGIDGGWSIEDSTQLAHSLKEIGVDVVDCSSGGLTGPSTAARVKRALGFQVPFARHIRDSVGIKTMSVGLIIKGSQAEEILQSRGSDLIAIGREALKNPNFALVARDEMSVSHNFEDWPEQYGWWLEIQKNILEKIENNT